MRPNRHNAIARASLAVFAAVTLAVMLIAAPSFAARQKDQKPDRLTGDDVQAVKRATGYFNKLRDIKGEFVQVGPGTHLAEGQFYLSKPGRLRFEYSPPNPLLVVADGTWVIINNRRLKTAEHYPISATPLRLLLAEQVDLLKEAEIKHVYQDPSLLTITLEDKDQLVPGQLTLVFDNKKLELQQWIIIDPQGNQITISLKNLASIGAPDPKLFKVKIPRKYTGEDR